ncbi:MAG: hypothetical protein RR743_05190, partial [Oscillospiraceae bacterium]
IVGEFFSSLVAMVVQAAGKFFNMLIEPIFGITGMTIAKNGTDPCLMDYVPGFKPGTRDVLPGAINAIAVALTIILASVALVQTLFGLVEESKQIQTPLKLLWRVLLFVPLTIVAQPLMILFFDNVIAKLSSVFGAAMLNSNGSGGLTDIAGMLGGGKDGSFAEIGTALVCLLLVVMIGYNFVALILESAERYVICAFIVFLSPLAFATGVNTSTSGIATKWFRMFWSQGILLLMNIWCVSIVNSCFASEVFTNSVASDADARFSNVVKWGLITYATVKIAQKLDDMMQNAGLSITRTGGDLWQDVMMASKGITSAMSGISGAAGLVAGLGKGAVNAVQGKGDWHENFARPIQQYGQKHPIAGGIPSTIASGAEVADSVVTTVTTLGQKIATASKASSDVSMPDSTRAVKQSGEKASNYNDQSHYTAAEKMIKNSAVGADALNSGKVEALRVNSDGSMSADVISRGKDGNVVSKSEFAVSTDADGQPSIVPIKKTEFGSSVDGTVGTVTDSEKGKFQVTRTGVNPKNGNEQWEATQVADANGMPIANDDMVSQPFEMRRERDSEGNVIANTSDNAARQFVNNGGVETLSASTTAHIAENESFAQDLQIARQDIAQTDNERINQFSNPDAARNYNDDSHKMAMKEKLADVGYDGGIAAGEN